MLNESQDRLFGGVNALIAEKYKAMKCGKKEAVSDVDEKKPEDCEQLNEKEKINKKDVEKVAKELEKIVDKINENFKDYSVVLEKDLFEERAKTDGLTLSVLDNHHVEALSESGELKGWWNEHTGVGYFHADMGALREELCSGNEIAITSLLLNESIELKKFNVKHSDPEGNVKETEMVGYSVSNIKRKFVDGGSHADHKLMDISSEGKSCLNEEELQEFIMPQQAVNSTLDINDSSLGIRTIHPMDHVKEIFGAYEVIEPVQGFNLGEGQHVLTVERMVNSGLFTPKTKPPLETSLTHVPSGMTVKLSSIRNGMNVVHNFSGEQEITNEEVILKVQEETLEESVSDKKMSKEHEINRTMYPITKKIVKDSFASAGYTESFKKFGDGDFKHTSTIFTKEGHPTYQIRFSDDDEGPEGKYASRFPSISELLKDGKFVSSTNPSHGSYGHPNLGHHDGIIHDVRQELGMSGEKEIKEETFQVDSKTPEALAEEVLNEKIEFYKGKLSATRAEFDDKYGQEAENMLNETAANLAKADLGAK